MNDNKLKHLEMIQAIISRMGSNSFKLKGWAITIIGALYAFWFSQNNIFILCLILIVTLIFWFLDAYYLTLERSFRKLFKKVSSKMENEIDFNMDAPKVTVNQVFHSAKSWVLFLTYGVAVIITLSIFIILPFIKLLKLLLLYY